MQNKRIKFDKNSKNLNLLSSKGKDFNNYITTINEMENGDLIVGGYDKKIIIYSQK